MNDTIDYYLENMENSGDRQLVKFIFWFDDDMIWDDGDVYGKKYVGTYQIHIKFALMYHR